VSSLKYCDFSERTLTGSFDSGSLGHLPEDTLLGCDFTDANLSDLVLKDADVRIVTSPEQVSLKAKETKFIQSECL